jgi:hypothetical protein
MQEMAMEETTAYERAKKRVEDLEGFYIHVLTFLVFVGGLALIDYLTGGGWWFYWIAGFWGIALAMHAMAIFVFDGRFGKAWEERKIREYMERDLGSHA